VNLPTELSRDSLHDRHRSVIERSRMAGDQVHLRVGAVERVGSRSLRDPREVDLEPRLVRGRGPARRRSSDQPRAGQCFTRDVGGNVRRVARATAQVKVVAHRGLRLMASFRLMPIRVADSDSGDTDWSSMEASSPADPADREASWRVASEVRMWKACARRKPRRHGRRSRRRLLGRRVPSALRSLSRDSSLIKA
jgi:hypothetical protein